MATPYRTDFGSANAGGSPAWMYFIRTDTGADLLPHPTFTESPPASGAFSWSVDWATVPAGVISIAWRATVGGVEMWDVITAPAAAAPASGMPLPYTSDELIAAAKRNGAIPTAQATYQVADFLAKADAEVRSYILPLVRRTQEDFYLQVQDYAIQTGNAVGALSGPQYRIPYRAVGGTLRGVQLLDAAGSPIAGVGRVDPDDLVGARGIYFMGNVVQIMNGSAFQGAVTLRMLYYLRPSSLVLTANAGRVASLDANARTVTLANVPSSYGGATSFDILRGRPGFEMLGFDLAGSLSGAVVTFNGALPADLAVGDYLCLPEQSPIPQIPAELHPLLAERLAAAFLRSQGDAEGFAASKAEQTRMEADALVLLSQRMGGEVKKITPRGLFRGGRRW